jgi:hypothetical protein
VTYPRRKNCPACDAPILLVAGARQGGTLEVFDPVPVLGGDHYDTQLAADLSHISLVAAAAQNLKGRVALYRNHRWSCPKAMRVPADQVLPAWGGYSHGGAPGKGPVTEAVVPVLPQPWQGITGTARDGDDLLSLAPEAMPRRRMMLMMALVQYRAVSVPNPGPAVAQMGRRMRDPQPGDLVAEISAARRLGSEQRGFGILLGRRREWVSPEAEWMTALEDEPDYQHGNDDGRAGGDAAYVQYGPGEKDVARWTAAAFIAILTDDRLLDGG